MSEAIRVLIVDDCPTLHVGLRQVFRQTPDVAVVGEAGDGRGTLVHIESLHPKVALLDCQLPGMEGTTVAVAVQRMYLQTSILAFSAYDDEDHVRGMLEAGAVGYVLKGEAPERLVEAVRAAARGDCWFSPKIAKMIAGWARGETPPRKEGLTEREREVLRFVARGWRSKQIAEELAVSEVTVRFHLRNIYTKTGVQSRAEVVTWAIRNGLADEK